MAGIVGVFAGPVMEVVKWPILRHLSYLFCFTSIITGLEHEAEELDLATRGLQGQVDSEKYDRDILPEVESWLSKSNDIKGLKDTILGEVSTVESGCSKLVARFSLSRRAKKTTDNMKELRLQKNFNPISVPKPPASTQQIPLGMTFEFESRKKIEQDIMATLRDGDMNIIGICGMGGLGKTTMAQRIMNRAMAEHVVEEAVITTISQPVDKSKVQIETGDSLGLKLQDSNSPQVRAQKLHERLTGTKRILLVLDDVWEGLELQGLGIPCDSKGCTILVTSRNEDALSEMNVQKVFGMEVLPLEDAWFLFRERAGTCVDEARLNPIAKKIVDECGGLPIALLAVGAALKDEKDVSVWKDALRQLRRCDQDIPSFIEKVYNPVKLSYDFLRSRQAKSLLLLCCLFPEDARIPLEQLTYFCMGLGIFEGIMNLERARNKMRTLAKMLKGRSLLLDGPEEYHVRMHDVVRDVCRMIAEQGKYIGGNDCAWISTSELLGERTSRLGFPNLRLFLLTCESESEEEFNLDNAFCEGIRGLLVLWIKWSPLTLLPQGTQQLKNLNTLVLWGCKELKTISVVGELVNLEILICRGCVSLEELPPGMKGLNRLKLLELTGCESLQSIGRGIISNLVGLEELKMLGSFKKWEAEDREERKNAGLKELQSLTNLICLEIEIEDSALVAENMSISTKLERFSIKSDKSIDNKPEYKSYEKRMNLCLERETCLGHWIEMQLLRETESLALRGNHAKIVDLRKGRNIKCLKLSECETTKSIVTTCLYDYVNATVFPSSLEHMYLNSLPQLQEVCISFQNLSSITISQCHRLPNLAKLSEAGNDCLPHLEWISISRCEMMEQVLLWKEEDNNNSGSTIINPHHVRFPKLNKIWLESLPNLVTLFRGIEGIELPLLTEIHIKKCLKWTSMVSSGGVLESKEKESGGGSSSADIHEHSSHFFCQLQKASFGNLKKLTTVRNPFCGHEILASSYGGLEELKISGYKGSRSLLSSSIAKNLLNLKSLRIKECDEIEQVIKDDDEEEREANAILFPKLEYLLLGSLPKLVSFCELKCDVVLPSLSAVTIDSCPKMENWSLGFVAAPYLEEITTDFDHHPELGVNVSFDRLKKLRIFENVGNVEYPFYHHKFFTSFLDGLEELELYRCGSVSSFPYSVVGKLLNLRSLDISHCGEIVKVIEEEEEDEVVVSGGRSTLLFPKLEKLKLFDLARLERFCERKCVVELPSLRKVGILMCPMMKCFSMGPLTAPNLEYINIDHRELNGVGKDLNGAVQQQYLITQQKEKKEMEEEEEEVKMKKNEKKEYIGGELDLNGKVQQHYLARLKEDEEEAEEEAKMNNDEKKEGEQKSKDDEIQDHQT